MVIGFFGRTHCRSGGYTLVPRKFKDVNGDMVDRHRSADIEMLRRKLDSALVWYEDFRDEQKTGKLLDGSLRRMGCMVRICLMVIQADHTHSLVTVSLLEPNGFSDIHLRAQIIFPENGGGKAGVFSARCFAV